jgi:2-oxo-4-hydroxy-4-carboxy--5-ureidoimidazoline (OHCU) decarboxylase
MPVNAGERIRSIGERMARTIEAAAESKAIEVIRLLQKAVLDSFKKVEAELDKHVKLLNDHNKLIGGLIQEKKRLAEEVKDLKNRLDRMTNLY